MSESLEWVSVVGPKLNKREDLQVVLAPRFSALSELKKEIKSSNYPIMLASQDLSSFGGGAYTGEEPAQLLKELVEMSIIGHSERRENFRETDETVSQKFEQAVKNGIEGVVCVQDANTLIPEGCKIAAYEPVFAIGTGIADTPENANKVGEKFKSKVPGISVLYGGSVTADNCQSFTSLENMHGLLIGKASLDPQEFIKIVENCGRV